MKAFASTVCEDGAKRNSSTLLTLLDLRRFDCANKRPKKLSLELASRSLSVLLLVEVSTAEFPKLGSGDPWGSAATAQGSVTMLQKIKKRLELSNDFTQTQLIAVVIENLIKCFFLLLSLDC